MISYFLKESMRSGLIPFNIRFIKFFKRMALILFKSLDSFQIHAMIGCSEKKENRKVMALEDLQDVGPNMRGSPIRTKNEPKRQKTFINE